MVRRWCALLVVMAVMTLVGCGELRPPGQKRPVVYHTVQAGDTLYSISWRYGYDYREVAAWNRIKPPYRIYPGQRLLIVPPFRDGEPSTPAQASATATTGKTKPPTGTDDEETPAPSRRRSTKPESPLQQGPVPWQWPTAGKVIRGFAASDGKKGIDISGQLGQPVYAASAGEVVYSGSGLVGYNNLIIIKHNDTYLSAYAHNRRLLVKEGERVKAGQTIAEMGQSSKDGAILHFEIRQEGKPIDPLRHLPRQSDK